MSENDFIEQIRRTADEAMHAGRQVRCMRKGGEVVEGVVEEVCSDSENAASSFNPPMTAEEEEHFGPEEHVFTIAGEEILAQEVAELTLLDTAA